MQKSISLPPLKFSDRFTMKELAVIIHAAVKGPKSTYKFVGNMGEFKIFNLLLQSM